MFDDMDWGSTLTGGASGAATGAVLGGPVGAGVGAGVGLLGGYFSGSGRNKAANEQRAAVDAAMKRLQQMQQQQYGQRMQDLDKIMSFYGPAQERLQRLYGSDAAAPTPSFAANAAPNPISRMMGR